MLLDGAKIQISKFKKRIEISEESKGGSENRRHKAIEQRRKLTFPFRSSYRSDSTCDILTS